ncbi:MAG TPA: molybdopterin-dependent oxidoreductase [Phenylobacterium sp.]|jgi:DMSO/TMAO reductase YedYZ molybdopterin-dependent catalytic subunit|uniref:molybdopterin-dependent oxidoreductase n=1 Tax=Phenylobacterium sp. TaxID=1871053 RepID=UPI002B580071|nr:molybdopterin-dependent oxidoreductase [Phenylobacterium sp.]HXA38396.1 molybdopterin-dependent oxidoreductase [Phenylobacterium sp.]
MNRTAKDQVPTTSRRDFLLGAGLVGAAGLATPAWAEQIVDLGLPGGPSKRPLTSAFPGKSNMILQRTRPPLLETPMEVFDQGVFTPNDRFFVRWHWAVIPTSVDVTSFRLNVHGHVSRPLSITLAQLLAMPRVQLAAVNQCSGNSRGLFQPRVAGGQWAHGAMGNARWVGVSLRHVLDLAGVQPGAIAVRFGGLDEPVVPTAPDFTKSIAIDHARDGEVMLAFLMNGEQLPLLNGFPVRLIVPGWYSTYWVKMLNDIEVLDKPDDGYWTAKAYKIPDTPFANVAPGATGFATVPINRMVPRAWITNLADGATVAVQPLLPVGGLAMGGDAGVAKVELSADQGRSWAPSTLGPDEGKYSFRRFDGAVRIAGRGPVALMARCTNTAGVTQPMTPNWNPAGFMRGCVETTHVVLA